MAETLSMLGLVVGFPLLLLCFMLGLEKLESWGLGEDLARSQHAHRDRVDAAVEQVEQLAAAQQPLAAAADTPDAAVEAERAVAAARPSGRADTGSE